MLLMSKAEIFSPKSANFFVTAKEKPRFNLRGMEDVAKSENATAIIAANTLRRHKDISVSRNANIANRLFMNGV